MAAYYNENDPFAAQWLRNLIDAGHLPQGDVDERSIVDVRAADLTGYGQCHFFAGIGGWAYALSLAGWPGSREVWTGSCPCQPLSSAGQRRGHADERHLWPAFYALIAERRPATVFGEQVASKDGREWLAGVRADLEAAGYACGAADLCAAGAGAPHIRQRLFWVANADTTGSGEFRHQGLSGDDDAPCGNDADGCSTNGGLADAAFSSRRERGGNAREMERAARSEGSGRHSPAPAAAHSGADGGLADADQCRAERGIGDTGRQGPAQRQMPVGRSIPGGLADADAARSQGWREHIGEHAGQCAAGPTGADGGLDDTASQQMGRARQPWQDSLWLTCLDGKARRVEPGIQPLASGIPNRVGLLRGAGNTIVPPLAAEFIKAFLEC